MFDHCHLSTVFDPCPH